MRRVALFLVVGIAIGCIIALFPPLTITRAPGTNPGPGLTSQEAYSEVSPAAYSTPHGPWGLISLQGIVATGPVAPFAWGQDRCQVLPGPMLWNLSALPSVQTTLWGGRTLFWQFVFLNDTGGMLFASDSSGAIRMDGPYPASDPCVSLLENGGGGLYGASPPAFFAPSGSFVSENIEALSQLDSSAWAPTAASHAGNKSFSTWGGGVAFYTLGFTWLNTVSWTEGAWLVHYQSCGIPERSGTQPYVESGWGLNSSPSTYYGGISGGMSCPVVTTAHFQITYSSAPPTTGITDMLYSAALTIGLGNGTYVYFDTANSLVSWMTKITIREPNGSYLLPAGQDCARNATQLTDCVAPPTSWYGVLLSPAGYLIDTFPSGASVDRWSVPNVFVTNNDTLAILSASSLAGLGFNVSIAPAFPFPAVAGGFTP
jgi:hypothetical protein